MSSPRHAKTNTDSSSSEANTNTTGTGTHTAPMSNSSSSSAAAGPSTAPVSMLLKTTEVNSTPNFAVRAVIGIKARKSFLFFGEKTTGYTDRYSDHSNQVAINHIEIRDETGALINSDSLNDTGLLCIAPLPASGAKSETDFLIFHSSYKTSSSSGAGLGYTSLSTFPTLKIGTDFNHIDNEKSWVPSCMLDPTRFRTQLATVFRWGSYARMVSRPREHMALVKSNSQYFGLSPDEKHLIAGNNIQTGEYVVTHYSRASMASEFANPQSLLPMQASEYQCAWFADSQHFLIAKDGEIYLGHTQSPQYLLMVLKINNGTCAIVPLNRSAHVAIASFDRSVQIYNFSNAILALRHRGENPLLSQSTTPVMSSTHANSSAEPECVTTLIPGYEYPYSLTFHSVLASLDQDTERSILLYQPQDFASPMTLFHLDTNIPEALLPLFVQQYERSLKKLFEMYSVRPSNALAHIVISYTHRLAEAIRVQVVRVSSGTRAQAAPAEELPADEAKLDPVEESRLVELSIAANHQRRPINRDSKSTANAKNDGVCRIVGTWDEPAADPYDEEDYACHSGDEYEEVDAADENISTTSDNRSTYNSSHTMTTAILSARPATTAATSSSSASAAASTSSESAAAGTSTPARKRRSQEFYAKLAARSQSAAQQQQSSSSSSSTERAPTSAAEASKRYGQG